MSDKLRKFFIIPREIRADFWQNSLKKNSISLFVISLMILGMEAYNIFRVLFLSRSGLGSVNNRIYFGMYCGLFLAAILSLILQHICRNSSLRLRWAIQYGSVLFFLLWHVGINIYDLFRNPEAEVLIYLTAILGLAIFIQMPSLYSIICYCLGYILFILLAGSILSSGTRLNLTYTTIVALAISLTNCHHAVDILLRNRELDLANRRLQELIQHDPLTGLLTKTAFRDSVELCLPSCSAKRQITMLIADLDKFKFINDRYGHPCGDYVLEETGRILKEVFPNALGIGRLGGDEFAAVMDMETPELTAALDRVNLLLGQLTWDGEILGACCSAGVCRLGRSGVSYDQLYREADSALYIAKSRGKGSAHLCEIM